MIIRLTAVPNGKQNLNDTIGGIIDRFVKDNLKKTAIKGLYKAISFFGDDATGFIASFILGILPVNDYITKADIDASIKRARITKKHDRLTVTVETVEEDIADLLNKNVSKIPGFIKNKETNSMVQNILDILADDTGALLSAVTAAVGDEKKAAILKLTLNHVLAKNKLPLTIETISL